MKKALFYTLLLIGIVSLLIIYVKDKDYKTIIYFNNSKPINEIPINNSSIELVDNNINQIIDISNQFKLTPKAIIGIILTEHSLNNSPANYFEELYIKKYFLSKDIDYLNKLVLATIQDKANKQMNGETQSDFNYRLKHGLIWTIGLCQISIIKAWSLEPDLSKLEKRKQKNIKEVISSLLLPKENLQYSIYELSQIRDIYLKNTGKDISDNHLILATLYNNGLVSKCKKDTEIKLNRFSRYIKINDTQIDSIIKTPHNKVYKSLGDK